MTERLDDPRHALVQAAADLTTRLGRAAAGRFQVEGLKVVQQAAAAGLLDSAFVVEGDQSSATLATVEATGAPAYLIAPQLASRIIGARYQTSLDVIGVVARRPSGDPAGGGLILVAEATQDPRNLGVMIRTAEAAGASLVICSDDAADPYSRPAVRSSTGSILRQPLYLASDLPATVASLVAGGVTVVAGSARAKQSFWEADLRGDVAILVGNETTGLSPAARAAATCEVALPTAGGASSLNVTVAAGIMLYEAVRQRAS